MDEPDGKDEIARLLGCATKKERLKLFADLFMSHKQRLRLMVHLRLDPQLQKRLDPSDVIQEAYLEASRRLEEYLQGQPMPLYLWMRRITAQKLVDLHRGHLRVKARDARREVSIDEAIFPEASSSILAAGLVEKTISSSKAVLKQELTAQIQAALESMDSLDREVLVLRHFERISNADAASILGIDRSAASKRHTRALTRLKSILSRIPGSKEDPE